VVVLPVGMMIQDAVLNQERRLVLTVGEEEEVVVLYPAEPRHVIATPSNVVSADVKILVRIVTPSAGAGEVRPVRLYQPLLRRQLFPLGGMTRQIMRPV